MLTSAPIWSRKLSTPFNKHGAGAGNLALGIDIVNVLSVVREKWVRLNR